MVAQKPQKQLSKLTNRDFEPRCEAKWKANEIHSAQLNALFPLVGDATCNTSFGANSLGERVRGGSGQNAPDIQTGHTQTHTHTRVTLESQSHNSSAANLRSWPTGRLLVEFGQARRRPTISGRSVFNCVSGQSALALALAVGAGAKPKPKPKRKPKPKLAEFK